MTSTESIQTNANLLALEPAAQELLFTAARTANTFSAEPVSDEQLKAITELAKWPPTMANTNPLRILFVRSPDGKQRLGPLMNEGNRAKTLSAPAVAILAVDTAFHEKIPELLPDRPELRDPMLSYDAEAIDREFFPDSPWQTILVVNSGKPGVDPWFDRLPRLAHEDFVAYV